MPLPSVVRMRCGVALALALTAGPALAGPPYQTDDPEPTDLGHWETYSFVSGLNGGGVTAGEAGFDINYGAAKDLQLTLVAPSGFVTGADGDAFGAGTLVLGAKYRFLHQSDNSWLPDVSFFPQAMLPTAARPVAASPLSVVSQQTGMLLPIWAQKDWGPWSIFGGGGWQYNPGPDQRNYWAGGVALTRQVSHRLTLGAELYGHTPDTSDDRNFAGANLGFQYQFTKHLAVIGSGGPSLAGLAREEGSSDFYLALNADF
jgi:hypothetical protein